MGFEEVELSILVVGDDAIRELNRQYRGLDEATDVLAFPLAEGPVTPLGPGAQGEPQALGDVVISLDTARQQAAQQGWALREELTFLLIHAILHLLGMDHHQPDETRAMTQQTTRLLALFGLPAPSVILPPDLDGVKK